MSPGTRRSLPLLAVLSILGITVARAGELPTAREQIGKPVEAARQLIEQKKFKEALAKLREVEPIKDKTPYEIYVIEETRTAAEVNDGDDADALKSLEAALATGIPSPAERLQHLETATQLAYRLKAYRDVVAYAGRYDKAGGASPVPRTLAAQSYYLDGDYRNAAPAIRAVLARPSAQAKPDEALLLALASSEAKLKNDAGYRDALTRLVQAYPKPAYWGDLLAAVSRTPGFPARLTRELDRLRAASGAGSTTEQYVSAAERALEAGFPGDAKRVLDRGFAAGVLGSGPQAERQKRLAAEAGRLAAADVAALPALAKEADAAADGNALAKLGDAYLSYGRYDEAIAALDNALRKGNLRDPDEAKLHLGIACLRAGRTARGQSMLGSVVGDGGAAALARLWLISGGGS